MCKSSEESRPALGDFVEGTKLLLAIVETKRNMTPSISDRPPVRACKPSTQMNCNTIIRTKI